MDLRQLACRRSRRRGRLQAPWYLLQLVRIRAGRGGCAQRSCQRLTGASMHRQRQHGGMGFLGRGYGNNWQRRVCGRPRHASCRRRQCSFDHSRCCRWICDWNLGLRRRPSGRHRRALLRHLSRQRQRGLGCGIAIQHQLRSEQQYGLAGTPRLRTLSATGDDCRRHLVHLGCDQRR